ncbi:MAG: hypothetical protein KAR79_03740 [Simkaniaceae bacterium]|nr:hypothetical protein [Simkaniaceae bacterium]
MANQVLPAAGPGNTHTPQTTTEQSSTLTKIIVLALSILGSAISTAAFGEIGIIFSAIMLFAAVSMWFESSSMPDLSALGAMDLGSRTVTPPPTYPMQTGGPRGHTPPPTFGTNIHTADSRPRHSVGFDFSMPEADFPSPFTPRTNLPQGFSTPTTTPSIHTSGPGNRHSVGSPGSLPPTPPNAPPPQVSRAPAMGWGFGTNLTSPFGFTPPPARPQNNPHQTQQGARHPVAL